jgi:DNA-binding response OmpR family regulator
MSFSSQQNMRPLPPSPAASTAQTSAFPGVLLLDSEMNTAKLAPLLRSSYRVMVATTVTEARAFLRRNGVDLIVTDVELSDGVAIGLCHEAKALPKPPAVLVTTGQVDRVPEALDAQCDGVLLKPFAPNLLFARIGRMLRARGRSVTGFDPRGDSGTNQLWEHMRCPHCEAHGVTSFEFASHRRAWFACRQCKKVWLGKRQE